MQAVLLLIQLLVAIALVAVVLMQRSEGGALGMGGGSMGGLLSARGSANLLTRATAVLAAVFIGTSLVLAILAGNARPRRSIIDNPPPAKTAPVKPQGPAVPLAK